MGGTLEYALAAMRSFHNGLVDNVFLQPCTFIFARATPIAVALEIADFVALGLWKISALFSFGQRRRLFAGCLNNTRCALFQSGVREIALTGKHIEALCKPDKSNAPPRGTLSSNKAKQSLLTYPSHCRQGQLVPHYWSLLLPYYGTYDDCASSSDYYTWDGSCYNNNRCNYPCRPPTRNSLLAVNDTTRLMTASAKREQEHCMLPPKST